MSFFQNVREKAIDSPLLNYWRQLQARDRLALAMLLLSFLLMAFYFLLWQPLTRYVREASVYHEQQISLNGYLHQNAHRARASIGQASEQLSHEQLQSVITSSAQRHGLRIERLDRDDEGLLVVLNRVAFESLILWLDELQGVGGEVSEIGVTRTASGQVEARVRLTARK